MAEYIEREAAKRYLAMDYAYAAAKLLDDLDAADVAPVVRCKACKHYDGDRCNHERHSYQEFAVWAYDDDFCSYGERRGEYESP